MKEKDKDDKIKAQIDTHTHTHRAKEELINLRTSPYDLTRTILLTLV